MTARKRRVRFPSRPQPRSYARHRRCVRAGTAFMNILSPLACDVLTASIAPPIVTPGSAAAQSRCVKITPRACARLVHCGCMGGFYRRFWQGQLP